MVIVILVGSGVGSGGWSLGLNLMGISNKTKVIDASEWISAIHIFYIELY